MYKAYNCNSYLSIGYSCYINIKTLQGKDVQHQIHVPKGIVSPRNNTELIIQPVANLKVPREDLSFFSFSLKHHLHIYMAMCGEKDGKREVENKNENEVGLYVKWEREADKRRHDMFMKWNKIYITMVFNKADSESRRYNDACIQLIKNEKCNIHLYVFVGFFHER